MGNALGKSNYNRELYRPDWTHLIRSQAFVNLWWKAHRAYEDGLKVVRAMGTDELHVDRQLARGVPRGPWRHRAEGPSAPRWRAATPSAFA